MDTIQLTRLLNNMPVKGEVCAKDQLPEKIFGDKRLHRKHGLIRRSRRNTG